MTESIARKLRALAACLAATVAATLILSPAARAAETIAVRLDQAKIARLPDRVSTIVVGNPLIADVTLQQGGLMVITGKGYGATNLIALDRGGNLLSEQSILVQGPTDNVVVVYRGVERESYSCTPRCERRITLGDSPDFFDSTLNQTGSRNSRAAGASGAAPGGAPAREGMERSGRKGTAWLGYRAVNAHAIIRFIGTSVPQQVFDKTSAIAEQVRCRQCGVRWLRK